MEQNPGEIIDSVNECIDEVCRNITARFGRHPNELIKAIGIANQRETTVAWNRETGNPLHNAIVWLDSRPSELLKDIQRRNPLISRKVQVVLPFRLHNSFFRTCLVCAYQHILVSGRLHGWFNTFPPLPIGQEIHP